MTVDVVIFLEEVDVDKNAAQVSSLFSGIADEGVRNTDQRGAVVQPRQRVPVRLILAGPDPAKQLSDLAACRLDALLAFFAA